MFTSLWCYGLVRGVLGPLCCVGCFGLMILFYM